MKGDPLAMVAYCIGDLLLIKNLKAEHPDDNQPCHADDAGALGTYGNIEIYFNSLKHSGPGREYYLKPSKSVLIVHPYNHKTGKLFGLHHGFKVCTDLSYLGSFIEYD